MVSGIPGTPPKKNMDFLDFLHLQPPDDDVTSHRHIVADDVTSRSGLLRVKFCVESDVQVEKTQILHPESQSSALTLILVNLILMRFFVFWVKTRRHEGVKR